MGALNNTNQLIMILIIIQSCYAWYLINDFAKTSIYNAKSSNVGNKMNVSASASKISRNDLTRHSLSISEVSSDKLSEIELTRNKCSMSQASFNDLPINIHSQPFSSLISSSGFINKLVVNDNKDNLMNGRFFHNELMSGLSIHGGDVVESSDAISSTQLPASLSLNILLHGKVNFCLGNKAYELNAEHAKGTKNSVAATCALSVLATSDLLSRKMTTGQAVKKVNLFVKRAWLEKRCTDVQSKVLLNKLFSNHTALYHWQDNATFTNLAQKLLDLPTKSTLQTNLLKEQMALTLLNELLAILPDKIDQPQSPLTDNKNQWFSKERHQLRKKANIERYIEQQLENVITLPVIAKHFGLSVSSLQRYFKHTYKLTITEYIRQQRLDKAKIAITIKELSISEAGYQAGYNHVSNFTSAFKKQFGITPANLLKLHQLDKTIDKKRN